MKKTGGKKKQRGLRERKGYWTSQSCKSLGGFVWLDFCQVWPERIRFGFLFVDRSSKRFKSFCDSKKSHWWPSVGGEEWNIDTFFLWSHWLEGRNNILSRIAILCRNENRMKGYLPSFGLEHSQWLVRWRFASLSVVCSDWWGHWWRRSTRSPFLLWVLFGATLGRSQSTLTSSSIT